MNSLTTFNLSFFFVSVPRQTPRSASEGRVRRERYGKREVLRKGVSSDDSGNSSLNTYDSEIRNNSDHSDRRKIKLKYDIKKCSSKI